MASSTVFCVLNADQRFSIPNLHVQKLIKVVTDLEGVVLVESSFSSPAINCRVHLRHLGPPAQPLQDVLGRMVKPELNGLLRHDAPRVYLIEELLQLKKALPCVKCDLTKFSADAWRAQLVRPPQYNASEGTTYFPADFPKLVSRKIEKIPDCLLTITHRTSRSGSSGEVVVPQATAEALKVENQVPARQPDAPPNNSILQKDAGFARFLKEYASPTHKRVTAGGRIVPNELAPAAPVFGRDNQYRRQPIVDQHGIPPPLSGPPTYVLYPDNSMAYLNAPYQLNPAINYPVLHPQGQAYVQPSWNGYDAFMPVDQLPLQTMTNTMQNISSLKADLDHREQLLRTRLEELQNAVADRDQMDHQEQQSKILQIASVKQQLHQVQQHCGEPTHWGLPYDSWANYLEEQSRQARLNRVNARGTPASAAHASQSTADSEAWQIPLREGKDFMSRIPAMAGYGGHSHSQMAHGGGPSKYNPAAAEWVPTSAFGVNQLENQPLAPQVMASAASHHLSGATLMESNNSASKPSVVSSNTAAHGNVTVRGKSKAIPIVPAKEDDDQNTVRKVQLGRAVSAMDSEVSELRLDDPSGARVDGKDEYMMRQAAKRATNGSPTPVRTVRPQQKTATGDHREGSSAMNQGSPTTRHGHGLGLSLEDVTQEGMVISKFRREEEELETVVGSWEALQKKFKERMQRIEPKQEVTAEASLKKIYSEEKAKLLAAVRSGVKESANNHTTLPSFSKSISSIKPQTEKMASKGVLGPMLKEQRFSRSKASSNASEKGSLLPELKMNKEGDTKGKGIAFPVLLPSQPERKAEGSVLKARPSPTVLSPKGQKSKTSETVVEHGHNKTSKKQMGHRSWVYTSASSGTTESGGSTSGQESSKTSWTHAHDDEIDAFFAMIRREEEAEMAAYYAKYGRV
ncbi:MAG: hypothetical protein M1817_005565 [Caeruleum heppii]|nr:MAG: hypothetical protein M1817_005565 [Caeruleum heppii]